MVESTVFRKDFSPVTSAPTMEMTRPSRALVTYGMGESDYAAFLIVGTVVETRCKPLRRSLLGV